MDEFASSVNKCRLLDAIAADGEDPACAAVLGSSLGALLLALLGCLLVGSAAGGGSGRVRLDGQRAACWMPSWPTATTLGTLHWLPAVCARGRARR